MAQKVLTLSAGGLLTEINDAYQGTVTSVAALTLGTTGTDLSSAVAGGTGAAVITLNVPTASAANRGALSSTDWSNFNGKAPLVSPSFTTPTLGVASATSISFGGTALANYVESTWVPTFANLTIVGTPTYSGRYTRIGRCIFFSILVHSTTTTSSFAGATYFALPVSPGGIPLGSTLTACSLGIASYGVGLIWSEGNAYTPAWPPTADVVISGFYFV